METKNITLISFDNWGYDDEIIKALQKKGVKATHFNVGNYKYKNLKQHLTNIVSKIFFKKNLKKKFREAFILENIKKMDYQDQILVLNPDLFSSDFHKKIKKYTTKYIAYLPDSVKRSMYPIEHLLKGYFNDIFSFDTEDCIKYGFKNVTNYIYLEENQNKLFETYQAVSVLSFDKRFPLINQISKKLDSQNFKTKIIVVSKNIIYKLIKYQINHFRKNKKFEKISSSIVFKSKKLTKEETIELYKNANVIIDLVQGFQSGLSFRTFEALALHKKILTDNVFIKKYNFYNSDNISVIENKKYVFDNSFFLTKYKPLPPEIYNQYTISNWVTKVFNL